jgi:hypothetical protein
MNKLSGLKVKHKIEPKFSGVFVECVFSNTSH